MIETLIGYLGIIIFCSVVFVWLILRRPERFNLDEESEALRYGEEPPRVKTPEHNPFGRKFYCKYNDGLCFSRFAGSQCLHCKIVESKTKGDV